MDLDATQGEHFQIKYVAYLFPNAGFILVPTVCGSMSFLKNGKYWLYYLIVQSNTQETKLNCPDCSSLITGSSLEILKFKARTPFLCAR